MFKSGKEGDGGAVSKGNVGIRNDRNIYAFEEMLETTLHVAMEVE